MSNVREPSEHFLAAIGGGMGGPSITCSCGRDHYALGSPYMDSLERREAEEGAKEKPDRVILHADDGVSAKHFNETVFVLGCPCNWLAKFEEIAWAERERILRYYQIRREADRKALEQLDAAVGSASTRRNDP